MIVINEWLPNPVGNDATGEWVELFNNGKGAVSLDGWALQTAKGKKIMLHNRVIGAGEYLVLKRSETKLALRNSDESVMLYNAQGALVGQSNMLGTAQEGKSFSRGENGRFTFAAPTPGAANAILAESALIANTPVFGRVGGGTLPSFDLIFIALSSAALIACAVVWLVKQNNEVSDLFFGND